MQDNIVADVGFSAPEVAVLLRAGRGTSRTPRAAARSKPAVGFTVSCAIANGVLTVRGPVIAGVIRNG
jgi:hypothetical protein